MPGQRGGDLVDAYRTHERTARTFDVLWLAVGGALLASPLILKRRVWQLGWRINGVGCGIAAAGFVLSGMGAFVWFVNGLLMEGANKDLSFAGYIGLLAGTLVAVLGSVIAAAGTPRPGGTWPWFTSSWTTTL